MVLSVVEIDGERTHDLRRRVLRDGRTDLPAAYPEDDDPDVAHLGAFDGDRLVGVATLVPDGSGSWQLRGMAVESEWQGRGVGRALLKEAAVRVSPLWAHARDTALGFYERLGWVVEGEGYVYGVMGLPHHRVVLPPARK